jgi:hypothetical protein
VTFTATVSALAPATGTPTGMVEFKDGGTTIDTATLSGGVATFKTSTLMVGTHTITATYLGDTNFLGSVSSPVDQTVNPGAANVALGATPNPSALGGPVTFTATVSAVAPAPGTPTGSVTFDDGNTPLGTAPLNGGVAIFQTSGLSVGKHNITAIYGGDSQFGSSTSNVVMQTVNPSVGPTVTIALASGQTTPTFNSPIQFSVVFSAPVTGFTGGVVVSGTAGPTTAAVTGSGTSYVVSVGGMVQTGSVTIAVPAGVAQDASNLPNQASTQAPTVTFQVNSILAPTAVVAEAVPAGSGPTVTVLNSVTGAVAFTRTPYNAAFLGGVNVATGDGLIVTGPGAGGGPDIEVYSASTGQHLFGFFAFDPTFAGGVSVAIGYVTGTNVPDIIVGAGAGGGPNVKVFNGQNGALLSNFFAFDPAFTGGVNVAAGDVNADGYDDIVIGAGAGGGPEVKVFSGKDNSVLADFFAFSPAFGGGVTVAAENLSQNGHANIIVGAGPGGGPQLNIYDGASLALLDSFFAYAAQFIGGVRVAQGGLTSDGEAVLRTGPGPTPPQSFSALLTTTLDSFFAFDPATNSVDRIVES